MFQIILIGLSLACILVTLINISKLLDSTKNIDGFVSGLTPDTKPSIIKNQAFINLRYELLNRLYFFRNSIKFNITLLVISVLIFIISFLDFHNMFCYEYQKTQLIQYYENNIKQKESKTDSLQNIILQKQIDIDSLNINNMILQESLEFKIKENQKLNNYIYRITTRIN